MIKTIFIILPLIIILSFNLYSQDSLKTKADSTEQEGVETEEVVITGTRTYKKIIDIPYSVFRVEKNEMTYGRNVNARDVLADVPGLFLQSRYGNDVRISIRGFGTRSNSGVRGIRILQDGIPESEPDGETAIDAIDFTSIGGIEVVKGNLSSLYTNSPGGVVNFLSDLQYTQNFVKMTNEIGDYGLYMNGLKFGLITNKYRFFTSYSYRNFTGYREHSNEYLHLLNVAFDNYIDNKTTLTLYGNYVKGVIKLPGSLTKEEFDSEPFKAYDIAVSSDLKRDTKNKGRFALRLTKYFGKKDVHEIEFTGFGGIKDIEFTTNNLYYITSKYKLGAMFRYTNRMPVFKHENELTVGIDYFYTNGPVTSYINVGGVKQDELQSQNTETLSNVGLYFQDQISIIKKKMSFLFSGRYDKIEYLNRDELFSKRNSTRIFDRFTPKFALNYKIFPHIALYTSFGFGFDSPSQSELENNVLSTNQNNTTLNPDIQPQKSQNFEFGIKGNIVNEEEKEREKKKGKKEEEFELFEKLFFELTFFHIKIEDEIVPYGISDRPFYRNAASTNRNGVELGIKAELFEGLEWLLNYCYTDFKYKNYTARILSQNGQLVDTTFADKILPAVPRQNLGFILEYKYKFSKNFYGLVQFDFDYVDKMYADDQNTEQTESYLYANPMAGLNLIFGNTSILISGGMKNIFNKKYVGFININANPEFPPGERRYYELGEPRSGYLNLNITYRF
jgi:iron complex outermembrane recepter protein